MDAVKGHAYNGEKNECECGWKAVSRHWSWEEQWAHHLDSVRPFKDKKIQTETGWLVERGGGTEQLEYIMADVNGLIWTTDNMKALRLARREDGDSLCEIVEEAERVVEHSWSKEI